MLSSNEFDPVGLEGQTASECEYPGTTRIAAMLDLWSKKSRDGDLPCRTSFSPMEMKDYLERIFIIEVLDDGADFLVRLSGTALVAMFAADYTGCKFSDERLAGAAWRLPIYRKAVDTRKPVIFRFDLGPINAPQLKTENILLPVIDQNTNKILLLGMADIVGSYDGNGVFLEKY